MAEPSHDSASRPRAVEVVVLSDLHLGTGHCQAEALERYLATIAPARVVLNGDILDLREMKPGYWPPAHGRVVAALMRFAADGIPVDYITGNHDGALRQFTPFATGSLRVCDELELTLEGRRTLLIHGDSFEHGVKMHWLLRRLGCWMYHAARRIDLLAHALKLDAPCLVRTLQAHSRVASHITTYEEHCARGALARGFAAVVTGHIHCARKRTIVLPEGEILYLNSGDWVHSLSALEFIQDQGWTVVRLGEDGGVLGVQASSRESASVSETFSDPAEDAGGLTSSIT